MSGLYNCIAKLVSKIDIQDKIGQELSIYMKAEGLFRIPMAIRARTIKSPSKLPLYYKISFSKLLVNSQYLQKRNRLDKKRLNDLIFVNYNRALKRRYDMRDILDPISLKDIDESNEWLLGRIDIELVEDDDQRTTRATSTSRATPRVSKSSNVLQLVDEEDASSVETDEEDVEGYKSNDEEEDYDLLGVDVEDD
ncbi:DUF659 domain-containing protein/Dimer_Tnp_hAT domain-containing protein [Cinnamomum micranthum f. kanehirae]|uniref:DUF659 domain-containing protein/Dimer_Tnp_hAT domain-containing protein n=1 Tax=Cinnamomum micranthum f. kanehirae TaxID=337451 RepID=A0A3S3RB91_9MAGN|nr:DUF659 domain-containing protein/Dimer_Tnp_hAT domain-containing protein [Cinnamomum micranthum f. kanehirae]